MADISKTIAIIFEADSLAATQKVDELATSLSKVEDAADPAKVGEVNKAIESVGESSKTTTIEAGKLGEGLKKMAADAGVPKEALGGLDDILGKMGGPVTGTVAVAAAALVAFAIVAVKTGGDVNEFKTKLDNLKVGSDAGAAGLDFVKQAVQQLSLPLQDGLDLYIKYVAQLQNTPLSAQAAEDAFIGIGKAIKAQGGDFKDTESALKKFLDTTQDGQIDLKELESKIADIPGALGIFAAALGVPIEDLKLLAENGKLGKEEIELFAEALKNADYGDVSPVKDAFNDLMNTFKLLAIDMHAPEGVEAGLWLVAKAIQGVTLIVTGSTELITLFGATLGNLVASIQNLDFTGFVENQKEIVATFNANIADAKNKFLGLEEVAKGAGAKEGATNYSELADSLKTAGDEAEPAAKKTTELATQLKAAESESLKLAKASADTEKAIAAQAAITQKATKDAQDFEVAMAKIASNEAIKFMEFSVELNIAKLEAQTQQIEAAFNSINETVEGSNDLIGELFGALADIGGVNVLEKMKIIEKQLEIENKLKADQLALQKELVGAQIDMLKAQANALIKGDAMITIDGAGLQPHLEAIMWEVIKAVQIKVNQQGLALLLGV